MTKYFRHLNNLIPSMKKAILLAAVAGIVGSLAFYPNGNTYCNLAGPQPGYTGAPLAGGSGTEPNCTASGCHSDNAAVFNDATITLASAGSSNITNGYTPGTQYSLTVNAGSSARYGFEVTALDANGNPAGTFALTSTSTTTLNTSGSRQYVGHKNAGTTNAWAFKWTAPSTATDVYFYLTVNDANGDGTNSGDHIKLRTYKATTSSFASVTYTGVNDLQDADAAGIKVYPNPVKDQLNLSYAAAEDAHVKADLYDMSGKVVMPLVDENGEGHSSKSFNVDGQLSSGIYVMHMSIGSSNYFKKILVQK
jgi:hypothetical protein